MVVRRQAAGGVVLFGLLRLLHIGLIGVRQDIANECCSSRLSVAFALGVCGAGLAFRLFAWLKGVGCAISAGRVRFVLKGFLLPVTVLSARELRFRVIYNCFRA